MKKIFTQRFVIIVFTLMLCSFAYAAKPMLSTAKKQNAITSQQALTLLKEGNQRFINDNLHKQRHRKFALKTSKVGQYPYAVVLSCMDSRSIPDIIFDQSIGNIFVARVAGNLISPNILGSVEYATKYAGSKLVVIMGHTQCGAVTAACENVEASKNLTALVRQIRPAVVSVEKRDHETNCADPNLINAIAKQNVINQIAKLRANSSVLNDLLAQKKIKAVGAMHDLRTGKLTFFDSHGNSI